MYCLFFAVINKIVFVLWLVNKNNVKKSQKIKFKNLMSKTQVN